MSVHSSKVFDSESISCVTNEANHHNVRMIDFDVSSCTNNMKAVATTRVQEMASEDYLPLLAATLASFALVLLILLAVFVYRHTLRVWIYSKYGVRVFDSSFTEDDLIESGSMESTSKSDGINTIATPKLFDIFVSYSPKDDLFVNDVLASELEVRGPSQYKTCLYHRDIGSQTFVADTILQATEASRRTIVVLSENFLKSEWSRYDYKSGLHQALRSGKKRLIFVMLGDVSSRDIDPDLRLYLKTSVVLNWGDRLFWEKLRYSLPDLPMNSTQNTEKTPQQNIIYQRLDLNNFKTVVNGSSSSGVSSIGSVEEHYYQQPRYATHLPNLNNSNRINNNFMNNNNSHRLLPPPPLNSLNNVLVNQQQQQQQSLYGLHNPVLMPSVPSGQELPGRTVIMHI